MYCVSTTTHLVVSMEPSHLQFPFALRNASMSKMNAQMHGICLKVYLAPLQLVLDSSTAAIQERS